ncbi:protein-tyrosine phosphatase-like protein [Podospora aff. communis PSN243]|uniref:Protein-tyrosine phosphatase-like protein n=1 Tax=Podospora aff. communis PSN243 TaxID=3040156 RepID=A0AAV9H5H3_9PEZI|nr:protein-tyrosine phosphatase-like protein [Podospora aff. communis PSN243]
MAAPPQTKQLYLNIQALRGGKPELGDLGLNDFHLVFRFPPQSKTDADPDLKKQVKQVWFAFHIVSQCNLRLMPPSSGIHSSIRIRFRDFTYVSFNFEDEKQARDAFEFIRAKTCRLGSIEKLLAFSYCPPPNSPEFKINGWSLYDARAEFRRQGISEKLLDLGWRITSINKDYAFSPTYPAILAVPSKISDNTLKYAASFRSRARIPTLTYLHPVNNCTITRSSQPFVGLRMKRSIQDERLVGACFSASMDSLDNPAAASSDSSPASSHVDLSADGVDDSMTMSETERMEDELIAGTNAYYDEKTGKRLIYGAQQHNLIVDARPAINSYAMQAIGMGSENMDYYRFAKKVFLNIDNIHVMRNSLEQVINAIKDADVSPFPPNRELLEKSKWLKHIAGILDGSAIIARQVGIQHSHALIHCSDGWDRTSQLCALSQLMLDPYYRTIDGFIVLVEKDWLSFGHMFQLRSAHLSHDSWFTVDTDALAGSTVKPGENDGRGDAIENALASAKRFWAKNVSSDKDATSSDADDTAAVDEVKQASSAAAAEGQATRLKDVSPVFHQFLDATYQLLRQHPTRFEFNERFLRRLLYHVYSCQYGTFLCNNERQRHEAKLAERTRSVWAYFLSRRTEFTNDKYDPVIDDHMKGRERLVFPRLGEVRWWHQVFNRTDDEMNGALNATAATAERVAAYQASSQPSSGLSEPPAIGVDSILGQSEPVSRSSASPSRSPQPPSLPISKSVLSGVESAHAVLTPEARSPPSLHRSSSTGEVPGALAALQDKIAGLSLGKGVFGAVPAIITGTQSSDTGSQRTARFSGEAAAGQEMRSME